MGRSKQGCEAYPNIFILEALCESRKHSILMLLFNNTRSCGKDSECIHTLPDLLRDAKGEENPQDLRPLLVYSRSAYKTEEVTGSLLEFRKRTVV
jgi:hypothetical protein